MKDPFVDYKDFARVSGMGEGRVKTLIKVGVIPGLYDEKNDIYLVNKYYIQRLIENTEEDMRRAKEERG